MIRRLIVVGLGFGGAAVLVFYVLSSMVMLQFSRTAEAKPASCLATVGPVGDANGSTGQQDAAQLDEQQRGIVGAIVGIGKQRQLPPRAWQIAIQAGKTESNLRNLDYGDRDSLGIFQMRPSMGWGTEAQLQDIPYQVNKFYDVLLEVPGWEEMRPGTAAQRVERSAFPERYHRWEEMAVVLIGSAGVPDPSGCGPATGGAAGAPSPAAGKAIEAALSQQGRPYVWGAKGPNEFDCSGLVYWAYGQAGVTIGMGTSHQWEGGAKLPLAQAQPGDLVFWAYDPADPESIHHVALYLGNDTVVQAPYSGQPVQVSGLHSPLTKSHELVPTVVRPGR